MVAHLGCTRAGSTVFWEERTIHRQSWHTQEQLKYRGLLELRKSHSATNVKIWRNGKDTGMIFGSVSTKNKEE